MLNFDDIAAMKNDHVKLIDIIPHVELHDLMIQPVERVSDDDNWDHLNGKMKVWEWVCVMSTLARDGSAEIELLYTELMNANFEEAEYDF